MAIAVPSAKNIRLTTSVSAPEGEQIAQRSAAAGLSISAYLRHRALDLPAQSGEAAAVRQIDALIDRMEADLDRAIAELAASVTPVDKPG